MYNCSSGDHCHSIHHIHEVLQGNISLCDHTDDTGKLYLDQLYGLLLNELARYPTLKYPGRGRHFVAYLWNIRWRLWHNSRLAVHRADLCGKLANANCHKAIQRHGRFRKGAEEGAIDQVGFKYNLLLNVHYMVLAKHLLWESQIPTSRQHPSIHYRSRSHCKST